MSWLYVIADQMVWIIIIVAIFECALYIFLWKRTSDLATKLCDSLQNILRGIQEVPEKDRTRDIHDEIAALLDAAESLKKSASKSFDLLLNNIRQHDARKVDVKTFVLDSWGNVANAIVQVFPLLGILGTILAIGQSMTGQGNSNDVAAIVNAFTNAINTTILGLLFAVLYMLVDALFQAKLGRLRTELIKYRDVIKYTNLSED